MLELSTYKPNFNNAPALKRAKKVMTYLSGFVGLREYTQMNADTIRSVFGNCSNNELSNWLKSNLLISDSSYVVGQRALGYKVNKQKYDKIECILLEAGMIKEPMIKTNLSETYAAEIAGEKPFEYDDKAFRLWHRIQFAPSAMRKEIFSGWYDYDIDIALPTMFWQLHQKYTGTEMPNLKRFIDNKKEVREEIAEVLEVDYKLAKQLLTALFLGAKMNAHEKCAGFKKIAKYFSEEEREAISAWEIKSKLYKLQEIPFIQGLISEIKHFWKTTHVKFNAERKLSGLAPIEKNLLYFWCERQVLDVVREYLVERNYDHFLEHDGFRSRTEVDIDEMSRLIKVRTGHDLKWSR